MSNTVKSARTSRPNPVSEVPTGTGATAEIATRPRARPRLKEARRPRLDESPATDTSESERRRRGRTVPGFPSRKGQKRVENLTKSEIIEKYSPMVRILALKLAKSLPTSVDKDDLISTGFIGLMDAADKYDAERGVKFETYAEFRVKGAMLDELRRQDWVPRSVRMQVKAVEKASQAVQQKKGRAATDREVSRKLGLSLEQYYEMKNEIGALTLLTFEQASAFQNPDAPSLEETIENVQTPDPFAEVSRKDAQALIEKLACDLSDQERTVVTCYYFRGLNLKEISLILDLTESRICQLHTAAIRKLKAKLGERLSAEVTTSKSFFLMLLNEA